MCLFPLTVFIIYLRKYKHNRHNTQIYGSIIVIFYTSVKIKRMVQ
nr:MAG TPA: hypothetical protein [Caudoviricetes sp.]